MFGNWTRWDKDSLKRIVKTALYVDEEETVSLNCEDEYYGDMVEMCHYINSMGIHCAIDRDRDSIKCSTVPIEQKSHPLWPDQDYYDRIFNVNITIN